MDDRKKQINDLEHRIREQGAYLDTLLVHLGEAIFGRMPDSFQADAATSAVEELAHFRKLKNNIADSEASIQAVEELIRRLRELEESIEAKDEENTACSKTLTVMYGKLGKTLLDNSIESSETGEAVSSIADFCIPYRNQADALYTKIYSLEERVSGLEENEGGNVFTWIGKGAQGLVLRSFLTKAQENLEQLRRTVGERYTRQNVTRLLPGDESSYNRLSPESAEVEELCAVIEEKRSEARQITQYIAELKEEKKLISGNFNAEGGPLKQIQFYKNQIAHARDELKALYRRIGAEAASINNAECRQSIASLILPEDKETRDNAARTSQLIHDDEVSIKKLHASLSIDDEHASIMRYRKMIQEKREKIAQAERNIMEYEENIKVSEAKIKELQEHLRE